MKSFWIKKENVTPELINVLHELGYKKNQKYFNEKGSDILMTSSVTKTYMFAKYELVSDADPHRGWLHVRDYCKTSDELIMKLKYGKK